MPVKRDWGAAREKVASEGKCRVCNHREGLEAAHTINRGIQDRPCENGKKTLWVNPHSILPLCFSCHSAYDARMLDILPNMTYEEQANAVEYVGISRAYARTTSNGFRS